MAVGAGLALGAAAELEGTTKFLGGAVEVGVGGGVVASRVAGVVDVAVELGAALLVLAVVVGAGLTGALGPVVAVPLGLTLLLALGLLLGVVLLGV